MTKNKNKPYPNASVTDRIIMILIDKFHEKFRLLYRRQIMNVNLSDYLSTVDTNDLFQEAEQEFGIIIPEEYRSNNIKTVGDLIQYIREVQGGSRKSGNSENPVILETTDKSISFTQNGKVLSLQDPRVVPYLKMLQNALGNKR